MCHQGLFPPRAFKWHGLASQTSALTVAVTFSANSSAKRCTEALPRGTMKEHIKSRLGYNVGACYNQPDPVVHRGERGGNEMNALVKAVHTAFSCHYPLVLSHACIVALCSVAPFGNLHVTF